MTRKDAQALARNEETWRVEMLWRLDSLTWTARQTVEILQYLRNQDANAQGAKKTEPARKLSLS